MDLTRIKENIKPDMEKIEALIQSTLSSDSDSLKKLLEHVMLFGGKRLRPALVVIVSKALSETTEDHIKLGAVVELIHTSSLVHDDILDSATMRRRVDSVNELHDNHVAVLLGDIIYSRAFKLSLTLSTNRAAQVLAKTTERICAGEIEQNYSRGVFNLGEGAYFRIIQSKTACLYAAACGLASEYATKDQKISKSLENYGMSLGTAFQIVDDCLDIVGDEEVVGKSLGTDAERGKITLPMIHLSSTLDAGPLKRLEEIYTSKEIFNKNERINAEFDLKGSVQFSMQRAEEYVSRALKSLEVLDASPYKEALQTAAEFVLKRKL